jgi:hypothetical protein
VAAPLISEKKFTPNQGKHTHCLIPISKQQPQSPPLPLPQLRRRPSPPINFLAEDFVISIPRRKNHILLGFPVRAGSPKARSHARRQWRSVSASSTGGWPSCTAPTPRSTGRMKSGRGNAGWSHGNERNRAGGGGLASDLTGQTWRAKTPG